jgi:hypothetical protein
VKLRALVASGVAVATVMGTATSCLQPNQHTLVGISGSNNASGRFDVITFTFDQGLPNGATARYVSSPPLTPSGKPVGVDGSRYVQVSFTPAVARDAREQATAPVAVYPRGAANLPAPKQAVEVAKYEDFEGYVGYAIGLIPHSTDRRIDVVRSGKTISIDIHY